MLPPIDLWLVDPMPLAPNVLRDSMTYWRWLSRVTLQARSEAR